MESMIKSLAVGDDSKAAAPSGSETRASERGRDATARHGAGDADAIANAGRGADVRDALPEFSRLLHNDRGQRDRRRRWRGGRSHAEACIAGVRADAARVGVLEVAE